MRTCLILGLSVLLGVPASGLMAQGDYTMYSSIPRVAGIKTLIDFNDYDEIIANAQGYVNVRYLGEGPNAAFTDNGTADTRAQQVGASLGMPVLGFTLDPAHSPEGNTAREADTRTMRTLTQVGPIFAPVDSARQNDAYSRDINRAAETDPNAGGAGAGAGGAAGDGPSQYDLLPKDRFGGVEYTLSKADLELDSWLVELNSSARTIVNRRNSYAKKVTNFNQTQDYLGVRVRFPTHDYNAHARIAPQYPFPAFDARGYPVNYGFFDPDAQNPFGGGAAPAGDGGAPAAGGAAPSHQAVADARANNENLDGDDAPSRLVSYNGVIHNVGDVRSMTVRVAGRNYRNGLALRLRNQNEEVSEYFLGYLDFVGWRFLRWDNPNYLPADEMEPFRLPLYPTEIPYISFDSFVIYRNGDQLGGDFVAYFDHVKIDYDLAVPASQLEFDVPDFIDIDDEGWWSILRDRNQARVQAMMREFSRQVDLRRQQLGRSTRHSEGVAPVENANLDPRGALRDENGDRTTFEG